MVRNNNYHKDNKKPYRTSFTLPAKDIQEQTSTSFDSFPQDIKSIITKLRITIDHIDSPRNYARDLIHELARQLDERRLCERGRISIKIKEILEDKIHAGKVTERWITKCLPPEYKREYIKDKRELSSLSKKNKPIPVSGTGPATQQEQDKEQVDLAAKPQLKQEVVVHASGQEAVVNHTHSPEENLAKIQEVGNGGAIDKDPAQASQQNEVTRYVSHIPMPFEALQKDLASIFRTNNGKVGNIFFKISVDLGKLVGQIECCGITPEKDVTMISIGKGRIVKEA